ncbi:MAG: transcriptional regulator [Nitrospiraceae bacterium]|nr:transcriptional regulator [Nitrospiraceae bacterium]
MRIEDGQTKDRIIMMLKKVGGLTADDLSKRIGITPMGVRQHLIALERKGIVNYDARKHGIGRPVFIYNLTEKADDIFPKIYGEFSLGLLKDLESLEGRDKINSLFRMRKERLLESRGKRLSTHDFPGRLKALSTVLEEEGYFTELAEGDGKYTLNQYNCPISKVAQHYSEACNYEAELLSELLGRQVQMKKAIPMGDHYCSFNILTA